MDDYVPFIHKIEKKEQYEQEYLYIELEPVKIEKKDKENERVLIIEYFSDDV